MFERLHLPVLCLALLLLALTFSLPAQNSLAVSHPGQLYYSMQTTPGAVPTSLTDVYVGDAYVCAVDIQASGQNILIQDKQGTPVPWINSILGSAGVLTTWTQIYPSDATCRHFPGGVSWQAGASGVTGYMVIKHN